MTLRAFDPKKTKILFSEGVSPWCDEKCSITDNMLTENRENMSLNRIKKDSNYWFLEHDALAKGHPTAQPGANRT